MNSNSDCYNTETPNELIRAAKTATLQYNVQVNSIITLRSILMKLFLTRLFFFVFCNSECVDDIVISLLKMLEYILPRRSSNPVPTKNVCRV